MDKGHNSKDNSALTYSVVADGDQLQRHIDQIRPRSCLFDVNITVPNDEGSSKYMTGEKVDIELPNEGKDKDITR